jgi:hypothetical protein
MAKARIRDTDKGWNAMKRRAKQAVDSNIVVGIFGEKADAPHPEGSGLKVGEIGAVHEFGAPEANIPERSFIRTTVDISQEEIKRIQHRVADKYFMGKLQLAQALNQIGLFVQGKIRSRISAGIPPPNAPSTIARKGSSKPLIDKGHLRASVDYEVRAK